MDYQSPKIESFELRHEVVLDPGKTSAALGTILFGAILTAVGILFLFSPGEGSMLSLIIFFPMGISALLLGIYGSRSSMERETVVIVGNPPQVRVRRFRAPKRFRFDEARVKVLREGYYGASEIEWISVDCGQTSDDGDTGVNTTRAYYYWHTIIKTKDLPPKKLGTFLASRRDDHGDFKVALEKAGRLGKKVARVLQVPFIWDQCPALKDDPSFARRLHKKFTREGWRWPWAAPSKRPSRLPAHSGREQ